MSTDLGLEAELHPWILLDMKESGRRHLRCAGGQTSTTTIAVKTLPLMNTKL